MKTATLCFLLKDDEICLALKKVRFGAGKHNGFGGKVGDKDEFKGETVEEALVREGQEEFGITIEDYKKVGVITFVVPHNPDWDQVVHVYTATKWDREPTESEEMKPIWFKLNEIPYELMWDDDQYWLPRVLGGEVIEARFEFDDKDKVYKHEIRTVKATPERK